MSGGSKDTVLKELMVMPWLFRSESRQVMTVTPVAKEPKPFRSSCEVNGAILLGLLYRFRRVSRNGCAWNWDQDFILFGFNAFKAIFLGSLG